MKMVGKASSARGVRLTVAYLSHSVSAQLSTFAVEGCLAGGGRGLLFNGSVFHSLSCDCGELTMVGPLRSRSMDGGQV